MLIGGCLELGTDGLPFAPFTAVLRKLVRDLGHDGDRRAAARRHDARGLARLLPEFGEPDTRRPAEARARLFEQVLGLLERLAEHRPMVLVIEDAHWADRSTRDLLSFLVRNLRSDARLLIVVTYRSDELHRSHPLRPLLAELSRVDRVARLELRRLTGARWPSRSPSILGRDAGHRRHGRRGLRAQRGQPAVRRGAARATATRAATLPDSLRDLLLASVERLPEETQELLRVASAGGSQDRARAARRGHRARRRRRCPARCARPWRPTCSSPTATATPSGTR